MAQPFEPTAINLELKGLYLNPSQFGNNVPPGALTIANNVVIDRPSVVATRRGFNNAFSQITGGALSQFQYNTTKLLHSTENKLYADTSSTGVYTAYTGTYAPPGDITLGNRIRSVEVNKNFYFITSDGTYRLDRVSGVPRQAGAPPGLNGIGVTTGTSGFLGTNTNIAYRVVFGYKDYNQQLVLGAPSSRIIVTNTSGYISEVQLTFQVPKEIQAAPDDYFFQVYRGNSSPNTQTDPDDEMALTYEEVCTSTSTITINDITPNTLLGAALYTNQGQDGILQSNYRPPFARDIATFKQYTFYADTRTLQTANITLIAAGASNGVNAMVPGDTITFTDAVNTATSFTLTATSSTNSYSTGTFQVSNTGNPALDIQVTASNLALVANAYATNTFLTAYYISNFNEVPGKLSFSRISLTENAFIITVSNHSSWEQALPITSVNDSRPNRLYYSKFGQPEAVPLLNYIEIGSANSAIDRIVPLRDGVMVLKPDGVYRISNAAPPYVITPIDLNVRIIAKQTAAELDNKVYFLSNQGVVALSDSDVQIKSYILDTTIIQNTSPDLYPSLQSQAWGIAYQSDRKYILNMPIVSTDTQATQQYVYNYITDNWTRWTLSASCGLVFRFDNKLYLGSSVGSAPDPTKSYVYKERKIFQNVDYADNEYTATNYTSGSTSSILISNPLLPAGRSLLAGWTVQQSNSGASARILSTTATTTATTTLTLDTIQAWGTGSNVTIYTPVYSEVRTIQLDVKNPGMNKQFSEIVYMFTEQGFTSLLASITSDTAGIPVQDTLLPATSGGWGIDPWGSTPWGGVLSGQGKIRRYLPQAIQRCGWLYINIANAEAFTSFGLSGMQLFYKQTSSRQK